MNVKSPVFYHIEAILTSVVWGTTFVSSKVLISHGLTPEQIMLLRFILAYICIWLISPKQLWAKSWQDELLFVLLGLSGGSLYFLAENSALKFTQACNVSIIISVTPLLTAIATSLVYKGERMGRALIIGAIVALVGIAFVVLNGQYVLKLNPIGDLLTISASLMWVVYGLILKKLQQREYTSVFVTRKVFFYGILTILPVFPIMGEGIPWGELCDFTVLANLCFLGIVASFLGYLAWNYVVNQLGVVTATNYLYLNPLATFITSSIVLQERITFVSLIGSLMILSGVYLSQKKMQH
jgi:drug/metabolite transporter (DMT)-like permease